VRVDDAPETIEDDTPIEWREARAIDLGTTDLGVVAKLDAVLLDGAGNAIPTEIKSGSGPSEASSYVNVAAGAWDADAIQVAIQAMALEHAGYSVPHAELYYRSSRSRVRVTLSARLRNAALEAIAGARAGQTATERPAPLVDSPKCRGCSLVEVCLPDESRVLREGVAPDDGLDETNEEAAAMAPGPLASGRRLVASSMETRTITVSTAGASVRKEGEGLVVVPPADCEGKPQGKPMRVAMDSIDALVVMGAVQVSTSAIMACLERSIAVSFHQAHGRLLLIVDSTVLRVVAEKRVTSDDFHQELQGVTLKPGARRAFLQALDQRREEEITHPVFGYRVTYRRAIELQARVLARVIEGETERYVALTTR
jgi:CRISPR-associated protein Cas4